MGVGVPVGERVGTGVPVGEGVEVGVPVAVGVGVPVGATIGACVGVEVGVAFALGFFPVPERSTTQLALLGATVTFRRPESWRALAGSNVIEKVHLDLAPRLAGQSFVWRKSPLTVMPPMATATLPVLVNLTDFALLCAPTGSMPNDRDTGLTLSLGRGAMPAALGRTPSNESNAIATIVFFKGIGVYTFDCQGTPRRSGNRKAAKTTTARGSVRRRLG